ncbi:Protein kinase domain-containing protein [Trichoderma simmonsii]|uniref:Protein kinase domain-containing protein n=1 Tax=Trichoderma simmonsii TaxID=1491479 RepID=A0A8G0PJY8_9HYPO|nr:Protein kinase domain-containing protein [Trichoderma simmonsii]
MKHTTPMCMIGDGSTNLGPDPPVEPITVTLKEYLYPEFFVFILDIIDEKLQPRLVPTEESPYWSSFLRFDDDFLDDLETWTSLYDPANIVISHNAPKDALFKAPKKVLIDNGQTVCFFKRCYGSIQITQELKTYKKIHEAGLDSRVNVCRLYGIVMDDCDFILRLLLTYIDCGGRPLSARVHPEEPDDPTPAIGERWMGQLETALSALHENIIVWGDVKAANVLIDENEDAWLVDFGGGYTEGWVDKEVAGTVMGDFTGMTRLRTLLFPAK